MVRPMIECSAAKENWIQEQVRRYLGQPLPARPVIVDDTSRYMYIERDQVIEIEGRFFLVRCNEREGRFGIDDQPKFWVKRALDLDTGQTQILKLTCQEQFKVHVGKLEVRCFRSEEKEARVLDLVRGDPRFMQGRTARDSRGSLVRIIDFISGTDLLSYLHAIPAGHEEYFHTLFPGILRNITASLEAIQHLHEAGLCHGDIRNDHLLIERATGQYRWIDFDLNQDFPDFDVWSAGNILHCVAAKGFLSFRDALRLRPELSGKLREEDASVFFPHRTMNLGLVYPYLPAELNGVLLRFSAGARAPYGKISQIVDELGDCAAGAGWPWR